MEKKITIGLRLASILVDHFAMTIICAFIMGFGIGAAMLVDYLWNDSWVIYVIMAILVLLAFSIYLNKDLLRGQSPAKRILNLQVIDNKTGLIASPLKCLTRNLIFPIWIVEIPFIFINPKRRLGDFIANTRIEIENRELDSKMNFRLISTALVLGGLYIFVILALYFIANRQLLGTIERYF